VILEAIHQLNNHPTAERIIEYIDSMYPNIATGTVYKVLNVLAENNLVRRVKTGKDVMRYDGVLESHHHMYDTGSDEIRDYFDEELDELLRAYFEKKHVRGFKIEEIVLQINGKFRNNNSTK
jgi:Fur family peroxide stress response transcriptional regulator